MNQVFAIIMVSSFVLVQLSGIALSIPYTHDRQQNYGTGYNNPNSGYVGQGSNQNQQPFGSAPSGANYNAFQGQPQQGGFQGQSYPQNPSAFSNPPQNQGYGYGNQQQYNNPPQGHPGGYKTHGY